MSFNYRVPLLTHALNWERTIYPTPSARVPLKASLGGKACHWDVWCSETGVILGGCPPKITVQHVQGWHAWTSGPHQRALWPEQASEQQHSALIRTLWELYSTEEPVTEQFFLSCCSLWYINVILIAFVFVLSSCLHLDRQYGQLLKHWSLNM